MAEDLWTIGRQRLDQHDATPALRGVLENDLRAAQPLLDVAPERWSEARANVHLLIDTMAAIAADQSRLQLDEEVYGVARVRLCPIFPIC